MKTLDGLKHVGHDFSVILLVLLEVFTHHCLKELSFLPGSKPSLNHDYVAQNEPVVPLVEINQMVKGSFSQEYRGS